MEKTIGNKLPASTGSPVRIGIPGLVSRILHQIRIGEKRRTLFPISPSKSFGSCASGKGKTAHPEATYDRRGVVVLRLRDLWVAALLDWVNWWSQC